WTDFAQETRLDGNPGFGIRFGHNLTPFIEAELSYHRSPNAEFTRFDSPTSDMEELQAAANFNWKRRGAKFGTRFQPSITFGLGYTDFSIPVGLNYQRAGQLNRKEGLPRLMYNQAAAHIDTTGTFIFGLGTRFNFTENVALRFDLRAVQAISSDFTDVEASL